MFKSSAMLVNSQLVSLPPVGVFKNVYVQFVILLSPIYGVPNKHFRAKIHQHLKLTFFFLSGTHIPKRDSGINPNDAVTFVTGSFRLQSEIRLSLSGTENRIFARKI